MPTVLNKEATGNIDASERKVDMAAGVLQLWPEETPLRVLTAQLSKRSTVNPVFDWLEDEPVPWVDQINNGAGYAAGDTALVVDNGAYFVVGSIVKVLRTGETMRVTAVVTNTITVVRSWGATAAAALLDNDFLFIMGTAIAEGADTGLAQHTKKVKKTNYTQIFRTPIKITGTLQASALYGGDERNYQRAKKGREHNWAIERALWFGEKNEDLSATDAPIRSTGGAFEFITTNVTTLANDAAFTLAALDAWAETLFRYGSMHRWVFASPHVMTLINALGQSKLQVWQHEVGRRGDVPFGINVSRYFSPHGVMDFVLTKLFTDWRAPVAAQTAGKLMFGLDFDTDDGVAYRYLQTRDTKLNVDIQTPGGDRVEDEYLTECGLQFGQERRHAILYVIA